MAWLPKLLSLIFLWGAVVVVLLYIEPELLRDILLPGLYLPFFGLLMVAMWYTLTLILRSAFYGLIVTTTLLAALLLLMLQLMHWGLGITIALTLVIESWYIYRNEKIKPSHEQQNRESGI